MYNANMLSLVSNCHAGCGVGEELFDFFDGVSESKVCWIVLILFNGRCLFEIHQ